MVYGGKNNTIGDWSISKLKFIERYLPLYVKATQKAYQRYYIDGFAGNGEWIHRNTGESIPGSAKIALEYSEYFTKQFFIELKDDRVQNLSKLIKDYSAENKATVLKGDCNILIPKVLKEIHPKAPTFVFLDPSGDHIYWQTIETLSKWKTELFLLYPYNMTIARNLPRNPNTQKDWQKERLNAFFGTNEWEYIYNNRPRIYLTEELLKLYTKRLKEIGYKHLIISDCFRSTTGQKLYYMIWVGKHPVGKKIMNWVNEQQSPQLKFDF